MRSGLTPNSELLTPARARAGFTLIELLLYLAITSVVVGMFTSVLVTFTRIQSRQSGASRTTTEMGFLMTTMKRLVHESSDLTVPDAHTLVLTGPAVGQTRTIAFDSGASSITQTDDDGVNPPTVSTLSSTNIVVDDLTFTDRSIGASKSVSISLTTTVFPNNPQQTLQRTLESTAALYVQEP